MKFSDSRFICLLLVVREDLLRGREKGPGSGEKKT
jgi:hypothetical protein